MEIRNALNTLAHDPYFCQGPDAGPGLGGLHIAHKLEPEALRDLAKLSREDLAKDLRDQFAIANPGMSPEQIRSRAQVCSESLEAAMLRQIDAELGCHAAKSLKATATDIRRLARDPAFATQQPPPAETVGQRSAGCPSPVHREPG